VDDPKLVATLNSILNTLGNMAAAAAVGDDSVVKNIVESKGSTFGKKGGTKVDPTQVRLQTEIAYKFLKKQEKPKSANLGRDKPRLVSEYTLFAKTFYKVMQQLKPDEKGKTKVIDPAAKAALAQQEQMNKLLKQIASGKLGRGGKGGPGGDEEGGFFSDIMDQLGGLLGMGAGGGILGAAGSRLFGRKGRKLAKQKKAELKKQKKVDADKKKAQKKQDADKKKAQKKKPKADTKKPKADTKKPKVDTKKPKVDTKKVTKKTTQQALKKGGTKAAVKTGAKVGAKVGSRFIPGVGWVLTAVDVALIAKGVYDVNKANAEAAESNRRYQAGHGNLIDKLKADQERVAAGGDPLGALVKELQIKQQMLSKQYNDKQYEYMTNKGFIGFGKKIDKDEQIELDRIEKERRNFQKEQLRPAIRAWQMAKAMRGDEKAREYVSRAKNEFEAERKAAAKRQPMVDRMVEQGMDLEQIHTALGEGDAHHKKLRAAIAADRALSGGTNMYSPQSQGKIPYAEDFMFRGGRFVRFSSSDDILGAKRGGALDKLLSRSVPGGVGAGSQPVRISNIASITDEIKTSNVYLQHLVKLTAKLVSSAGGGARAIPVPSSGGESISKAQGSPDGPSFSDSRVEFYNSPYSMHTPGTLT